MYDCHEPEPKIQTIGEILTGMIVEADPCKAGARALGSLQPRAHDALDAFFAHADSCAVCREAFAQSMCFDSDQEGGCN